MKRASILALIIFLSSLQLSFANERAYLYLRGFARVNGASGTVIRSWKNPETKQDFAYILTANHALNKANIVEFLDYDNRGKIIRGEHRPATVVSSNEKLDYAILIAKSSYKRRVTKTISREEGFQVGVLDDVISVGSPNLCPTVVTKGIISGIATDKGVPNFYVQDTNIYFGSSGGPLFNTSGEMIAINCRVQRSPEIDPDDIEKNHHYPNQILTYIGFSSPLWQIYDDLGEKLTKQFFGERK